MSEQQFREELAVIRFWKRQMKSQQAKQALDKLMYFVIVSYHKASSSEM